jgi:hypothetical protein
MGFNKMAEVNGDAGGHESLRDLVERISGEAADAREAELLRHQSVLESELKRLNAEVQKLTRPEPERRRSMTAKRKSELIRKLGLQRYSDLPW